MVGLDRASKPRDRLLITAEKGLRDADENLPSMGTGIARAEAQGLADMSLLYFFGTADVKLTHSDKGVGAGKISIQLQRVLAFGDAQMCLVNI